MAGKLVGTILIIIFLTYILLFSSFYFLHQTIVTNVNDINYNVAEVVATSGEFSQDTYDYLKESLYRYGRYDITLKLEKYIKDGIYDTYFDKTEILDKKLKIGDRLTIFVEDQDQDLFGKLVNATFLGYKNDKIIDTRTKSLKSVVIANSAKDIVKGYDIIAEINNYSVSGDFTAAGKAVWVITKMNSAGRIYGIVGHPDVAATNITYGDSSDEKGNTGPNYIFDNGDFSKEVEYYGTGPNAGMIRLIKYIQQ